MSKKFFKKANNNMANEQLSLLISHIEASHLDKVQGFLKVHSNLLKSFKGHYPVFSGPLHEAVWQNNPPIIKMLIDADVGVNSTDMSGKTALEAACLFSAVSKDTMIELFKYGAAINPKDHSKYSALMEAVSINELDKVNLLVERYPESLTYSTTTGITPLYIAIQTNQHELTKLILEKGGDKLAKLCLNQIANLAVTTTEMNDLLTKHQVKFKGLEAIEYIESNNNNCSTIIKSNENILQTIPTKLTLTHPEISASKKDKSSPLPNHYATASPNPFSTALDEAINVMAPYFLKTILETNHTTLLFNIILKNDHTKIQKIIDLGVDVNSIDPEGRTLLQLACIFNSVTVDTVEVLLNKGANVNFVSKIISLDKAIPVSFNYSAIQEAVLAGNIEKVRLLVKKGAVIFEETDVITEDIEYDTPLSLALQTNNFSIVSELLGLDNDQIRQATKDLLPKSDIIFEDPVVIHIGEAEENSEL